MALYLFATNPGKLPEDQAGVPCGRGAGVADGFFLGRMPNKNRTPLNGLTSSSYRTMISAKEATTMIRNFGRMPIFQRIANQQTHTMTVWWRM